MVHRNMAYFSQGRNVHSYTVSEDKWTELPKCKYGSFALAVVKDKLTSVGGEYIFTFTNSLCSFSGISWEELLPLMQTKRTCPAAVTTPTHLVVAGGSEGLAKFLSTVEVLHLEALQWSTASSLPVDIPLPQMTLCKGFFYLSHQDSLFSCSVEDLLKSCKPAVSTSSGNDGSVWTELVTMPEMYGHS